MFNEILIEKKVVSVFVLLKLSIVLHSLEYIYIYIYIYIYTLKFISNHLSAAIPKHPHNLLLHVC